MSKFLKLIKNSKGATAIEYGLIAARLRSPRSAHDQHRHEAGQDVQQRFELALETPKIHPKAD